MAATAWVTWLCASVRSPEAVLLSGHHQVHPARPSLVPSSRFAAPRYVPASGVWSSPVVDSPLRLLPFVPMVLFVFPVLLSTPFGFALSFVPLLC